ncbi:MAG: DUF3592 domain-containing protein [Spirochaetales bacterium]|nr:DUF3592 domain-containing protein [Spirochaetales bacterium]
MADKASFVFSGVFAALGLGLLIAGSVFIFQGIATNSWIPAEGLIVESYGHPSTENPGEIGRISIQYEYMVENSLFSSDRISFHFHETIPKQVILDNYPEGRSVTIRYKPGNPKVAVLIPGTSGSNIFLPAGGVVFLFSGIFLFLSENKKRRGEMTLESKINKARKSFIPENRPGEERTFQKEFLYPKHIMNMAGVVFIIILGLFIMIFPIAALKLFAIEQENMTALYISSGVCGLIGLILILNVLNMKLSMIRINFSGEKIEVEKKSILKRSHSEAKLEDYIFITPRKIMADEQFGGRNNRKNFIHSCAVLIHKKSPKKDIEVRLNTRPDSEVFTNEDVYIYVETFAEELAFPVKKFT